MTMHIIFSVPSFDDLIRLLRAWRFWSVGALIGGLLGAGFYYLAPPPYRAHAVVLVDFNLEQAWPQETDRQQFYYLERETRKMEELAFSDEALQSVVAATPGITLEELRGDMLRLSQPAEGGWNFYVDGRDPQQAALLATTWATRFTELVRTEVLLDGGLNSYIEAYVTRAAAVPVERSASQGLYIFTGAVLFLMAGSVVVLFVRGRAVG